MGCDYLFHWDKANTIKGGACPLLGLSKNLKARAGKKILRGRDVLGLVERTMC